MATKPKPTVLNDYLVKLGAIEKQLELLTEEFNRERDKADELRAALQETIAALSEAMRMMTKDVADMKPTVDDYKQNRAERKGREKLGRALMALWMAVAGTVVAIVTWLVSHWKAAASGMVILGVLLSVALAHEDHTWDVATRQWFKNQKSPKTGALCCDENDGAEAEEDIRDGRYWARWPQHPTWMLVPDDVVIRDPNRNGAPVVWWWWQHGVLEIKCYAPGGGV